MKKTAAGVFLALAVAALSGCGRKATEMEGNWIIDMDATLRQAQAAGASNSDLNMIQDTFGDAKMSIDRKHINLSIEGIPVGEAYEYKVTEMEGNCVTMQIKGASPGLKGASGRLNHCVSGNRLEVHDPDTPLITVYKRQ